ncbi:hypothetical protein TNIN_151501 [Trichonephila inaurata madagascariensis]|uniref:Uncharacterized protein n=1 Tax=Trichonephila inaurata madagascariensis TaxID=2747483 RepID=A0A8X7CF72_9ARAC|nr:hypothetical protein TNIN_151501 [Trichonephila inaurata madagascariensis]
MECMLRCHPFNGSGFTFTTGCVKILFLVQKRSKRMDYFNQFDAGGDDSYLVRFYKHAAEVLEWGELENETILFLGRGDGNDCCKLLNTFPHIKQILDVNCTKCLRRNNSLVGSKVKFYGMNLNREEEILEWVGATKILCVICLTFFENKKSIFQVIYRILANGGSAAFIFFIHSSYAFSEENIFRRKMYKDTRRHLPCWYTEKALPRFDIQLRSIGFQVKDVIKESYNKQFSSLEEIKDWILSITFLNSSRTKFKETFLKDIFDIFMRCHPRHSDSDLPNLQATSYQVFVVRTDVRERYQFQQPQRRNISLNYMQGSNLLRPPLNLWFPFNIPPRQTLVSNRMLAPPLPSYQYFDMNRNRTPIFHAHPNNSRYYLPPVPPPHTLAEMWGRPSFRTLMNAQGPSFLYPDLYRNHALPYTRHPRPVYPSTYAGQSFMQGSSRKSFQPVNYEASMQQNPVPMQQNYDESVEGTCAEASISEMQAQQASITNTKIKTPSSDDKTPKKPLAALTEIDPPESLTSTVELPAPKVVSGETPTSKEGSGETTTPREGSGETTTPREAKRDVIQRNGKNKHARIGK